VGVTPHSLAARGSDAPDRLRLVLLQPKLEVEEMLAEALDVVIGVDTHRDRHVLALVDARTGGLIAEAQLAANRDGYRRALRLGRAAGAERVWAVEGTGAYGAGLARLLARAGERVLEVERPTRPRGRNGRLKADGLDALRAARSLLAGEAAGAPRASGEREGLRCLLVAREAAVAERQAGLNQLRALVLTAPERLRQRLQGLPKRALLNRCLQLRAGAARDSELRATMLALRSCARRVELAHTEANQLERELRQRLAQIAPWLLALPGVGPSSAAHLLVAWSHPGRLKSEAAFARLAGTAPIPASSGRTVRHRLDRGGDRKLNRALHQIILSRRQHDPATIAYIHRRLSEGKTIRETIRCLKRYLARSLFRKLEQMPQPA
jgi:transposase